MQGDILMDGHAVSGLPAPPCARVYSLIDQAIPSEEDTPLIFDTKLFDSDDMWGAPHSLGVLWINTPGLYLISATASFEADANGYRGLGLWKTGEVEIATVKVRAVATGWTSLTVTTIYWLAVDDYVEVHAFHDVGGGLDVLRIHGYSPHLMVSRLGTAPTP